MGTANLITSVDIAYLRAACKLTSEEREKEHARRPLLSKAVLPKDRRRFQVLPQSR